MTTMTTNPTPQPAIIIIDDPRTDTITIEIIESPYLPHEQGVGNVPWA